MGTPSLRDNHAQALGELSGSDTGASLPGTQARPGREEAGHTVGATVPYLSPDARRLHVPARGSLRQQ